MGLGSKRRQRLVQLEVNGNGEGNAICCIACRVLTGRGGGGVFYHH